MAVIDLRDDPRMQMQLTGNIGQGIGQGIQMFRRTRLQQGIVSTLQNGIANGLTPVQMRAELLKLPGIVNTQIGQELAEAQTGTGRYYQHPLNVEYLQSRIDATKELAKQRGESISKDTGEDLDKAMIRYGRYQNIYNSAAKELNEIETIAEINETKPDPKMVERLKSQMEYGWRGMSEYMPENRPLPFSISNKINAIDQTAIGMRPSMQKSADRTVARDIEKQMPKGLEEIWDELNDEEKQTAMQAIQQGKTPEQIVTYFKAQL